MLTSDSEKILQEGAADDKGIVNDGFIHDEQTSPTANSDFKSRPVRKLWKWKLEGMTIVVLSVVVLSCAITLALIISIILGDPQVKPHAVVASENERCSLYGLELMSGSGGNAVDAAVATALCIAVTRPDKASLAGCGLMLVRDRNVRENQLYDFMCPSPSNLRAVDLTKPETTVGVPGFIRGLKVAHAKFGQRPWSELFKGAIQMASEGFQPDIALMTAASSILPSDPVRSSPIVRGLNAVGGGRYVPPPDLMNTLTELANRGSDWFYQQDTSSPTFADRLLAHMRDTGLSWSSVDLTDYLVQQPKPIQMGFAGFTLETFPAPSSTGPFLLSVLGNLDLKNSLVPLDKSALAQSDANTTGIVLHRLIELVHIAEQAVSNLGDPYDSTIASSVLNVQNQLFSPDLRTSLLNLVNDAATGTSNPPPPREHVDIGDTGILVSDSARFTVIINTFLGSPFGSGSLVPNTGVHLNAALRLFPVTSPANSSSFNVLAAGRRPLAPVSPVYLSTTHKKCGVRVGLVSTGGFWGAMDSAQVIVSAALFLRNSTCRPPADASSISSVETGSSTVSGQSNQLSASPHRSSYSPAADYGCINSQTAIDLPRIHLNVASDRSALVSFEPELSVEFVRTLERIGHKLAPYAYPWPGRVLLAGWNGYSMISSTDKRGSWSVKTY